jgi:tripartite-type tricarboxylate transporter receptor subunit TctC
MVDVMGGHTTVLFSSLVQTTPHIKSGKLRPLGVGGTERSKVFPDLPTIAEAGVPGYAAENWWGLIAPVGTPPDIVAKLHKELTAAQDNPEVKKYFDSEGATIVKLSSTEFGKFMVSEMNKWERVVKDANIKAQ